ncbi:MAG TPA: teichoic acid transporter, partial [Chryseobacterium sp.]|nr:teichoic acid transporter [Chryseobacterium sp.]
MKLAHTIQTVFARFLTLGLNFGLIILTANVWGSTGRGIIALLIADLSIVVFATHIFAGGAVSFFASKYPPKLILRYAYIWSTIVGIVFPIGLSLLHKIDYLFYLVTLSVISSMFSSNTNLFIGLKKIKFFNTYTIL